MAKAVIIYESIFGDNEKLAHAIRRGLEESMEVEIFDLESAPGQIPIDTDLLVVGGPTQAFGLTRPATRRDVPRYAPEKAVPESGIREWLGRLRKSVDRRVEAVAFGTNVNSPAWVRRMGAAARGIERRLSRRGYQIIEPAQVFLVADATGPLMPGEEERARVWGQALGHRFLEPEMRPG